MNFITTEPKVSYDRESDKMRWEINFAYIDPGSGELKSDWMFEYCKETLLERVDGIRAGIERVSHDRV